MEAFIFVCLVLVALAGFILSPTIIRTVAHIAITPESVQKLRRAISDDCSDFDTTPFAPAEAEEHIAQRVRHTIGRTLAEINPKTPIAVTRDWPPEQRVILTGDMAVISPSIGWLIMPHSRIEPLQVRVKRAGLVNLDNRKPLKAVHDAIYEPPAKQAVNRPAPATPSKPVPKAVPLKKPGGDKLRR
jgi:hypothetical protein